MGLSLSGTHVILFIISVILASTVSGVLVAVTTDVSTSLSERGDRLQNQLDTDFEIINDPYHIPTSGSDYLFYLKNTGDIRIITTNETFQILVDGIIISEVKYNFSKEYIYPGDVVMMYVDNSEILLGDHTMRIIDLQGNEDEFTFNL